MVSDETNYYHRWLELIPLEKLWDSMYSTSHGIPRARGAEVYIHHFPSVIGWGELLGVISSLVLLVWGVGYRSHRNLSGKEMQALVIRSQIGVHWCGKVWESGWGTDVVYSWLYNRVAAQLVKTPAVQLKCLPRCLEKLWFVLCIFF